MSLKRPFLWTVLGALAASAAVAIWAVVADHHGGDRWLGSALSTALFGVLILGAAAVIDRRVWRPVMYATIALCLVGVVFFYYGIWSDYSRYEWEIIGKTMAVIATWSISLVVAGLLALTRFSGLAGAARTVSLTLVLCYTGLMSVTIVVEPREQSWFRFMGAMTIATMLCVVGLPILYRVKGVKTPRDTQTTPTEMSVTCPRCLLTQTITAGECRCARCRLRFTLEIEEPRCPECDYLLYRLSSARCPECGHVLAPDEVETAAVAAAPAQSSASASGA